MYLLYIVALLETLPSFLLFNFGYEVFDVPRLLFLKGSVHVHV